MSHLNIEFKARCARPCRIRSYLLSHGADFRGEDRQIDTYFNVPHGRLKLREGTIENTLIHYDRTNQEGPKASHVTLFQTKPPSTLKDILTKALGVRVVVDKTREIYFVENVKFHIDQVSGLGSFVEVEAIDLDGTIGRDRLQAQCDHYLSELGISPQDLISQSYSDLLLRQ